MSALLLSWLVDLRGVRSSAGIIINQLYLFEGSSANSLKTLWQSITAGYRYPFWRAVWRHIWRCSCDHAI